ncbi:hypothetical protein [Corallococcus macrosporus]|uniref:Uncharacterized protein n=1 Tax=Myxococcus fulvus (strain ATCC BAA-855 / HW-1) TaxID=483219 RepID=F8CHU8_MYXFH|nr:hypothetical protein [Corallococcus macrosporus]AEI68781.1 hypothetical protein LILAB_34500 [Corallococcus macrosporus]
MKLLGRDIPARELIARIEERLRTRGLPTSEEVELPPEGVEPRVEPLTFNLHALEENADATRALPLHTHRGGLGQAVLLAKWAFRKSCQVFINEALGRQRVFNGHVRDSYAQLSAEVLRLRREVEELRARQVSGVAGAAAQQERAPRREPGVEPLALKPPAPLEAAATAPAGDTVLPKPRDARPSARPRPAASPASTEVASPQASGTQAAKARAKPPARTEAPAAVVGAPAPGQPARTKKAAAPVPAQSQPGNAPRRSTSGQKKRRNKKSR